MDIDLKFQINSNDRVISNEDDSISYYYSAVSGKPQIAQADGNDGVEPSNRPKQRTRKLPCKADIRGVYSNQQIVDKHAAQSCGRPLSHFSPPILLTSQPKR